MRIVFMGTPDYSAQTLKALINSKHDVVAVFAQPDKPVGRKQILTSPVTKVIAQEKNIPVFQPSTLRDGEAFEILKKINPDVIVVVAYGKILPKEILNLPKYGCINGHASLLPKLRGASPIQWSIVTGETETGITTMLMNEGMDTGDILEQISVQIHGDETAEQLFNRLSDISAELMLSTLEKAEKGQLKPVKQNEKEATYAPIIKKEMAHLDFTKNAKEICDAVRGFYSWPCAFCIINGKRIKVIKARSVDIPSAAPSTVVFNDDRLVIACGDGKGVELLTVQPEGSKIMDAAQMLNGYKIIVGTVVE